MIAATMLLDASQGLVVAPMAARSVARTVDPSMGVGLVYSTTTGNTETVAGYIAEATGLEMTDIADLSGEDVAGFDGIIVGAPTWHTGADTERSGTAWDEFIYGDLTGLDLKGKKVAIFGLGDQSGYGDNFCDAMDELKSCFSAQGAEVVGSWSTDGYDHMESKSVEGDKFVGLACDEDNQPDQSEERVKAWIAQIKGEGMPL
jgi:flavodoxin I